MQGLKENELRTMVDNVISRLEGEWKGQGNQGDRKRTESSSLTTAPQWQGDSQATGSRAASNVARYPGGSQRGVFSDVDQAVASAKAAQKSLARRSLAQRKRICELIMEICNGQAEELGRKLALSLNE